MSADSGSDLIAAIKGNLGDRQSGLIGGLPIDTVALNALNRAQFHIAKKYNIETLQRDATIDVSTSAYQYALPTTDVDGNVIDIKNFVIVILQQDDETTGHQLTRLSRKRFRASFPIISTDFQGRPIYYGVSSDKLEMQPYPDDDYTARCKVNVWPTKFTSSTLGNPQPFGPEWDEVLEMYATFYAFAKLQQPDDAASWFSLYRIALKDTVQAMREKPDQVIDAGLPSRSGVISNPTDNAFVRSKI